MRRSAEQEAATRHDLLVAALAEFAASGYAAATLAAVAARAGTTRDAACQHFPDKATLYLAAVQELGAEAATPVWSRLDGPEPPLRRIADFLVAFFTALERDTTLREVYSLAMRGAEGAPELEPGLKDKQAIMEGRLRHMAELLRTADLRPGVSPGTAALTITTAVNGTAATWLACRELFSPAEQARPLADAILYGLAEPRLTEPDDPARSVPLVRETRESAPEDSDTGTTAG
ncbi:TetR/AcrR family transcriptional regulator [Nonomuraea sp. bgisy101]|uniref:TetR/AcrR family transcriptional regulator n=1 Tax=Nonomuraea sp. bgisy101 TaxID=3413784 RepID=UPI003D72DD83